MIRAIAAAAFALALSACVSTPPRYEYAVIFVVPVTGGDASNDAGRGTAPSRR